MQYIKLELGCLIVVLFLAHQYMQAKRPGTTLNLACRYLLITGCVNLLCQAVAVCMANYMRTAPQWIAKFGYQLYYITLCAFLFMVAYYLLASVQSTNLLLANTQVMLLGMLGASVLMTLLLPLNVRASAGGGVYAQGPMSYVNQFATLFYLSVAGYYLMKHRDPNNSKRMEVFLPVVPAVMLLSVLQFVLPTMTMSGISVVLICLAAVMTADSTEEFVSFDNIMLNNKAFGQVANDWMLRDKKFAAIFVVIRDMALLEENLGKDVMRIIMRQIQQYISTVFKLDTYLTIDGCLAVLTTELDRADTIAYGLEQRLENEWIVSGVSLTVLANVCRFDMPDPYSNVDDLMKAVMEQSESAQRPVVLLDKKLGLKNKKAFDRALMLLHHERKSHTSIYYLIADVTGMHKTNTKHGYIAGDKMLQDCADVLRKAAGEDIEVYRVGGDEFAILLLSRSDKEIRDLLERIQTLREECNKERGQLPLEIAVGYSRYYEDSDKSFTSMMARADFQMNNLKKHMNQDVDLFNTTRLGTQLLK